MALLIKNGKSNPTIAGLAADRFPDALQAAHHQGRGQIVAIVDAYDNPNVCDRPRHVPQPSSASERRTSPSTTKKAKRATILRGNANWGLEDDLDIEMVSAVCPKCTIYLVEANSNNTKDLEAAEAEAVNARRAHHQQQLGMSRYERLRATQSFFDQAGRPLSRLGRRRRLRNAGSRGARKRRRGRRHRLLQERFRRLQRDGLERHRIRMRDRCRQAVVAARFRLHVSHR